MTDTNENQRLGVAYHEAGHTIVAIDLDWSVKRVLISKGSADWKGQTEVMASSDDGERAAFFAGGMVSREIGSPDSGALLADQQDENAIDEIWNSHLDESAMIGAFELPEDKRKRQAFLETAERRAAEVIRRRWPDVELVARALLKEGELGKDRIDALLSSGTQGDPHGKA